MKKNNIDPISEVYVGKDTKSKAYCIPKIGQSKDHWQKRENSIRRREEDRNFRMMVYLPLFNATKADRLAIESHVRQKMQKYAQSIGDDHFRFPCKKGMKDKQYEAFALIAIGYAIDACKIYNVQFGFPTWVR